MRQSIQEATDKVYIGKVGNKYLKGHSLVKSASQADVFESETEPRQRLNQMKKDDIVPKKAKVKILSKKDENKKVTLNFKESMKFIMERSTESFRITEGSEYEILYDENIDKYGLLVDGVLFCFLTPDQAKTLSENIKNKEMFEKFFNSVGIGDKWLNLQPRAACDPNYKRPTGDLVESKLEEGQKLNAIIAAGLVAIGTIFGGGVASAKSFEKSLNVQKTVKAMQEAPRNYKLVKNGIAVRKIKGGCMFADNEGNYAVYCDDGSLYEKGKVKGTDASKNFNIKADSEFGAYASLLVGDCQKSIK